MHASSSGLTGAREGEESMPLSKCHWFSARQAFGSIPLISLNKCYIFIRINEKMMIIVNLNRGYIIVKFVDKIDN